MSVGWTTGRLVKLCEQEGRKQLVAARALLFCESDGSQECVLRGRGVAWVALEQDFAARAMQFSLVGAVPLRRKSANASSRIEIARAGSPICASACACAIVNGPSKDGTFCSRNSSAARDISSRAMPQLRKTSADWARARHARARRQSGGRFELAKGAMRLHAGP